jgi:hypothetical protein
MFRQYLYTKWGSANIIHKVIKYLTVFSFMSFMRRVHEFWIFQQFSLLVYWGLQWCHTVGDQRGVVPADCWNWGKWGLMEYQWRGPSWLVRWTRRAGTRDFYPALAALVAAHAGQNSFPSADTISINMFPSPSNLGRQSCRAAYLWICVFDATYMFKKKRL